MSTKYIIKLMNKESGVWWSITRKYLTSIEIMPQIIPIIKVIKWEIMSTIYEYSVSDQRTNEDAEILFNLMENCHRDIYNQFDAYILDNKIIQNHWFETNLSHRYSQYFTSNIIKWHSKTLLEFERVVQYLDKKRIPFGEIIRTKVREAFVSKYIEMMFENYNKNYSFQLYPTSIREDVIYGSDYLLFITNNKNQTTSVPIDLKTYHKIMPILESEKEKTTNPQYYYNNKYQDIITSKHPRQRNILITTSTEFSIVKRYTDKIKKGIIDSKRISSDFEQEFNQQKITIDKDQNSLNSKQFSISNWKIKI